MPTIKRRINITVNDEMWQRLVEHRNKMGALSLTTAAIDLIVQGLKQDGIEVDSAYDDLRERVDRDIQKAQELENHD